MRYNCIDWLIDTSIIISVSYLMELINYHFKSHVLFSEFLLANRPAEWNKVEVERDRKKMIKNKIRKKVLVICVSIECAFESYSISFKNDVLHFYTDFFFFEENLKRSTISWIARHYLVKKIKNMDFFLIKIPGVV